MSAETPLGAIARLFEQAAVPYVVIGAHAVNAWIEPRITADIDVTVDVHPADLERLKQMLADEGYHLTREHGAHTSGPDFVRFVSDDATVVLELQVAKTAFQLEVIRRGVQVAGGPRVATAEDLIVLKLIANRPKDQADLHGLAALSSVDWSHVERWAAEWGVLEHLRRMRGAS